MKLDSKIIGIRRIVGAEFLIGKTITDYLYNEETHEQALMFSDNTHMLIKASPDTTFDQMGVYCEE